MPNASYNTIHEGSIVSIQLPKVVTLRSVTDAEENVLATYLHWTVNMPGGVVNMHVHSDDMTIANTTIRARVELKIKTTENGRQFLMVDFYPVDKGLAPTHKLVVLPDSFEQQEHWEVFPTPGMRGFAALIEPNEKLIPPPTKYRDGKAPISGVQRRAPGSAPRTDTQLERLLSEGWAISKDDGTYVTLRREGRDTPMTHYRPKHFQR